MGKKSKTPSPSFVIALALSLMFLLGCAGPQQDARHPAPTPQDRYAAIPQDAVKMLPENDSHPPILHSSEFEAPVPLPAPLNSAGGEDSPFITPDGNTLYFFFTPDVSIPAEKQVLDNVTGIWASHRSGGSWSEPQRVVLQDAGKLALDGCEFVDGNTMWFCTAREGHTGLHWFTAEYSDGAWRNWRNADFPPGYEVGELHITTDGRLYFHSARAGGKTGLDIWVMERRGGKWEEPENVAVLNSPDNEGWPFVSRDGRELWFTRFHRGSPALFRSKSENNSWSEPELIVSQFAGEPTLDDEGNLYFVHHYYRDSEMIEADIYAAYKK